MTAQPCTSGSSEIATDRDDALHSCTLLETERARWQEMAEDLWEELQEWHTQKCPKYRPGITGAECVCHRILAAKWDEITHAADYADDDGT